MVVHIGENATSYCLLHHLGSLLFVVDVVVLRLLVRILCLIFVFRAVDLGFFVVSADDVSELR